VREFWIGLVPYFEEWQQYKALPDQVSGLKQHVTELDERCATLELAVEREHKQMRQHSKSLRAKDRELAELKTTLHEVEEKDTEERERHRALLARHRASVRSTPSQRLEVFI